MLDAAHTDLQSVQRRGIAQVSRDRNASALGLAHDGLDERWRELLIELQAIHTAFEELPRHAASFACRSYRHADAGAVPRPGAIDQRSTREDPGPRNTRRPILCPPLEDVLEPAAHVAHGRDAMAQKQCIHPGRLVV